MNNASAFTKTLPELWSLHFSRAMFITIHPVYPISIDAFHHNIATQRDLGFLSAPLDINSYADLSLVKEAAKQLNP